MLLYESLTLVCLNKLFETRELNGTMSLSRSHALCLCLRLCVRLPHSQHGMFKNTQMLVLERDALLKVSQRISCDAAGLLFLYTKRHRRVGQVHLSLTGRLKALTSATMLSGVRVNG
jgi:hypothetical protein